MAIAGKGCFVCWCDLRPGHEAGHDFWHTHEHMIERVAIPGFRRGARYRSLVGSPRVCVIYQGDSVATFGSPAYLERLNNPTPWSTRNFPIMVGMNRTLCTVAASFGHGIGGVLMTMQLSPAAGEAERLKSWLSGEILPTLAARSGLSGAHLLVGDQQVSQIKTQEKVLRGNPDAIADWIVLVEGYDQNAVEQALAELTGLRGVAANGAKPGWSTGLYRLDFTLGEDEAKKLWRAP